MRAFQKAGFTPNVTLSASDADVMKAYGKYGMGVAILAAVAYDRNEDRKLRAIDASHLFEPNRIYIGMQKHVYVRRYVVDFIQAFIPSMTRDKIMEAVSLE